MKKPRAPSPAQRRKQFATHIANLAVELASLGEAVKTAGVSAQEVAAAFQHLQTTLIASQSACAVVAQTNDAGKFSLDPKVVATIVATESVTPAAFLGHPPAGFVPRDQYEGRFVGTGTIPHTPAPVASSTDGDGEGMMMVD